VRLLVVLWVFFGVLPNVHAWGYQRGNGGNVVQCSSEPDFHFLDLYLFARYAPTSRVQYQIASANNSIGGAVRTLINVFAKYEPKRAELYRQWLEDFHREAQFINDMPDRAVKDQGLLTPIQLNPCSIHQLVIQWQAPVSGYRYSISKPLWDSLSRPSRATAIFHELVLREPLAVAQTDIKTRSITSVVGAVLGLYYYEGTEYQAKYESQLKSAVQDLNDLIARQSKH
jgi:hypothetical protein